MQYLDRSELRRLFHIAYDSNRTNHLCLVTMFWGGLRVSEALAIKGTDICDGQLAVKRLKKSKATLHTLKITSDVLFDQSPHGIVAQTVGVVGIFVAVLLSGFDNSVLYTTANEWASRH